MLPEMMSVEGDYNIQSAPVITVVVGMGFVDSVFALTLSIDNAMVKLDNCRKVT